MGLKLKKSFILSASTGFFLWILGFYLYNYRLAPSISKNEVAAFEEKLNEHALKLKQQVNGFVETLGQIDKKDQFTAAQKEFAENPYEFFVYANDSLDLWTTNTIPVPGEYDDSLFNEKAALLSNGWYYFYRLETDSSVYVGSFLIKNQFAYENEDLVNDFSPHLASRLHGEIYLSEVGFSVKDSNGNRLFSVQSTPETQQNDWLELTIFFCYLFAFVILLQLLINAFQKILIKNSFLLILFPSIIVGIRYSMLIGEYKGIFEDFRLFNPELFASSVLAPSLGDLIINVAIFYFLVHFLLKRTRDWFTQGNRKLKLVFFLVPLFLISFYAALQINDIIYSLVFNSKISFDLEHLFDLDMYSFICLAIIGASFYAYFKLMQYIVIQLKKSDFELNKLAFLWAITSGVYILFDQLRFDHSLLTSFWPIILSGSLLWFEYKEKGVKFFHVVSILAFVSFYAAYILQDYSERNEWNIRKLLAEQIATDKDPLTEYDFAEAQEKIIEDGFVNPYLKANDFYLREFSEKIKERYFDRLRNKYDMKFYLFNANKKEPIDFRNYDKKEFQRQHEIIEESGVVSPICPNLYFVKDYTDKLNYIGELPIVENDSVIGYLFSELRSKKFPDDIGLPSLLLDSRSPAIEQRKSYSMAKYVDDRLVMRNGDYNYSTEAPSWYEKTNRFISKGGYSHYLYQEESGYITLMSKPLSTSLVLFTSFSYLLILFGILLLIPIGFEQLKEGISFRNIKLNVRIQAVLIGLVLTTLIAFAIGAGTFVVQQKHESNKDLINEKMSSVRTELEGKLKKYEELSKIDSDYLEYLLQKFSKVFITDINLYNEQGGLLASSQPKIYLRGLVSDHINTEAYNAINLNNKIRFIHKERIGKLNYLSAYTPFFNQKGEFLAYLNVQHISRQNEQENQISGFLLAIINIMVLMLAISTILAITVSNRLTQPLKSIQERLKTVKIGSVSKPIAYEGTDEIGELVMEYNKMVDQLQKNAEKLAKSERESAWREMAKQVAHEIKNPLTPMKLSIQHLKRSINFADDDSKEKLDKVTNSLIEQIDALSQIANEFSNFAKMPKAEETELNLASVVENAASVFAEYDQHTFELDIETKHEPIIWADKDLLLRVFNNLIKNAIQAVSVGDEGKIKISLLEQQDTFVVRISDNGVGIKEEEQDKIFVPYFTTKSTGTGLGLAMSKQIIEGMQGDIWFESDLGKGTTFYVSFPKLKA